MLNITQECIEQLKIIRDKYLLDTQIPAKNNWKGKSDDKLWLDVFKQVVVVGNSYPVSSGKIDKYEQTIAYEKLKNDKNPRETIHKVLRAIGTMWVGDDIDKSDKTKFLTENLKFFKSYPNEVKGFFTYVEELNQEERTKYVIKNLGYIGNKSARDLLMELGLIRNSIALDTRIVNCLKELGVNIPSGHEKDRKLYAEIENELIEKICKPLNLEGIELDRLLYQNYDKINTYNFPIKRN